LNRKAKTPMMTNNKAKNAKPDLFACSILIMQFDKANKQAALDYDSWNRHEKV